MDRLQTLNIFRRVAETRSFTKAANLLNLPRSTVTQAVQRLEQQLKVQLLVRTTRQVRLTEQGEQVLDKASALLADWDDLQGLFAKESCPAGLLRINMPARLARLLILPALPEFHQCYPDIELELGVSDPRIDIIGEGVDLAMRAGTLEDSNLIARSLGSFEIVTLASPDYLARFGVPQTPSQLSNHKMVGYLLPASGRIEPLEFRQEGKYHQYTLPQSIRTNGTDAYIAAGLAGFGLIQVPTYGIAPHLQSGALVPVLQQYPPQAMPLSLIYPRKRHPSHRLKLFIDWLVQRFGDKLPHEADSVPLTWDN
ncbi:MAG: LysR family transcriptional regulator [Shewanella algae]|uniref:LysR family transcriptional regulator n=1 Tax=Shewanella algae TaxID=38313 RepID=UPI001640E855|nr:LysR family transcriptional regulator [Shewanella algae]QNI00242.1 LysR family transcriptional regulator [Shewanella algae]